MIVLLTVRSAGPAHAPEEVIFQAHCQTPMDLIDVLEEVQDQLIKRVKDLMVVTARPNVVIVDGRILV